MNKTTFNIILVLAVAGAGFFAYKQFFGGSSKEANIDFLKAQGLTTGDISSFGDDFLKAWAKAGKKGDEFFPFEGKTYRVNGGKAV
jgi:hypothetical protein